MFGVSTPSTFPVLSVGASSSSTSMISLADSAFNGWRTLSYRVVGRAFSSATTVSVQTRFFNASGTLIRTDTTPLHSGDAGLFQVQVLQSDAPTNATQWRARLVVEDGAATFSEASADGFLAAGCAPPPDPPTGDNGSHGCRECSVTCEEECFVGTACPPDYECSATCEGASEEEFQFQSGVTQTP